MQGHQQASQLPSDIEFLQAKIQDMTPVDVWNLVRMKILPYFTPWDYVCDRTRVMATKFGIGGGGGNNGSSRSGHQNTIILFSFFGKLKQHSLICRERAKKGFLSRHVALQEPSTLHCMSHLELHRQVGQFLCLV